MRLDFLLLADAAQFGEEGKVSILGGAVNRVTPPKLPFVLPQLALVARIVLDKEDESRQLVSVRVVRPDGTELASMPPRHLSYAGERQLLEGEEPAATVVIQLVNLSFEMSGLHRFELLIGDRVVGSATVMVAPQEPAA